jgi:MarR family transcriptional regulator, 2-MHQ and catechol-resistance regulon repressor
MVSAPHIRLVLWKAAKAVEKIDRSSIAVTGLRMSDFQILEILLHKGPQPINAIGEKVLLTSGSMTAATKRLEKRSLVRRVQNPSDGRCFNIHLTAGGKSVIKKAYAIHVKNLEKVVSVLTSAERSELVRLLKKIGYHADRLNQGA